MPGGKGNIRPSDNPKPFKKGQIPNPKGRPKKIINQIKEVLGLDEDIKGTLTADDYASLATWMLEKDKDQLLKIAKSNDTPIFIVVIANAILSDIRKGRMVTVESVLDRFSPSKKESGSNERKDILMEKLEKLKNK